MEKIELKIKKYEKIIVRILNAIKNNDSDKVVLEDKQNKYYQLIYIGLNDKSTYSFQVLIHFHLRNDGIICLYENRTEIELIDLLGTEGVPKSDILVGFLPQSARQYAGYAAA